MDEVVFGPGSVPVAVAARVYGKDACWVRAGIITGYLSIGTATRNGKVILNNCDPDSLRQRAMPKETKVLSQAKINRIKAMSASYTIQQIADKLGISTSTVSKYLKGAN